MLENSNQFSELIRSATGALSRKMFNDAEVLARKALRINANSAQANQLLGLALHGKGYAKEALSCLDKAVVASGDHPSVLISRAAVALSCEQWTMAEDDSKKVLARYPTKIGAWMNLGLSMAAQQHWQAARDAFFQATQMAPGDLRAKLEYHIAASYVGYDLPNLHLPSGIDEISSFFGDWARLLTARVRVDRLSGECLAKAVWANVSSDADLAIKWMRVVREAGLIEQAQLYADHIADQHPSQSAEALLCCATITHGRGLVAQTKNYYQRLLSIRPDYWQAHSNYVIALQYDPDVSQAEVDQAHRAWNRRHLKAPAVTWMPQACKGSIRIAWISPRFCGGPTESFFAEVLSSFPGKGVEHWVYKTHPYSDSSTARFTDAAHRYVDASRLNAVQLVDRVREDRMDIAVDLCGHSPHHNLHAFSQRMAPIQLSWLDYFNPTHINAIDYFVSDRVLSEDGKTEDQLILPHGRLTYSAPLDVAPIKGRTEGCIRFGSFNRIAKINDQVLQCWAGILDSLPESELELRSWDFDVIENRDFFLSRAAQHGIPSTRLSLLGSSAYPALMDAYNNIDIALDPFPFSGCATSCDALWMGVPVITLAGRTMVGRQTQSLLWHAGLTDWIADSQVEYQQIASKLAESLSAIRKNRTQLSNLFLSACGNTQGFASDFEGMLKALAVNMRITG